VSAAPVLQLDERERAKMTCRMAQILVVDDALFMRKMVADVVTEGGHEVVGEASNGVESKVLESIKLGAKDFVVKPSRPTASSTPSARRLRSWPRVAHTRLLQVISA
jgi:hypothetical protein